MLAITQNLFQPGPRKRSPQPLFRKCRKALVVAVEEPGKIRIEEPIAGQKLAQNKRLKEPGGVRQVPLGRARPQGRTAPSCPRPRAARREPVSAGARLEIELPGRLAGSSWLSSLAPLYLRCSVPETPHLNRAHNFGHRFSTDQRYQLELFNKRHMKKMLNFDEKATSTIPRTAAVRHPLTCWRDAGAPEAVAKFRRREGGTW